MAGGTEPEIPKAREPRHYFIETPDGEAGLNYLCEGYKAFFKHADKPMPIMADPIRQGKTADGVMKILPQEEKRQDRIQNKVGRNDPCYCGSGIKFKKFHGRV